MLLALLVKVIAGVRRLGTIGKGRVQGTLKLYTNIRPVFYIHVSHLIIRGIAALPRKILLVLRQDLRFEHKKKSSW